MRIILLDHSGSMGSGFRGEFPPGALSRFTEEAIKLESAKQALIESLPLKIEAIAIFGFTSRATKIYEGMTNEVENIRRVLSGLRAQNGTSIAAALEAADNFAAPIKAREIIRVQVISDGLSEKNAAERAAERLAARGIPIDVILIDETREGRDVGKAIAIGGNYWPVSTTKREAGRDLLSRKLEKSVDEHIEMSREALSFLHGIELAAEKVMSKVPKSEKLSFTAGYPERVLAHKWYSLLVYMHLSKLRDATINILNKRASDFGFRPQVSISPQEFVSARGALYRFEPQANGVLFNPPHYESRWFEDIQELPFRFCVQNYQREVIPGQIDIYANQLLIAQLPIAIQLSQDEALIEQSQITSGNFFKQIFASYSRRNSRIVNPCVAIYEALGIYVYVDKKSLRSGEHWNRMLLHFIENSDAFQLYWSISAAKSEYVRREWQHALRLCSNRKKHEGFIRPLYWQKKWPKPPRELSHIHFAHLDTKQIMNK